VKDKFPSSERGPESTAAAKKRNARKLSSSRFHTLVVEGARSTEERPKGGKLPLTSALVLGMLRQQERSCSGVQSRLLED